MDKLTNDNRDFVRIGTIIRSGAECVEKGNYTRLLVKDIIKEGMNIYITVQILETLTGFMKGWKDRIIYSQGISEFYGWYIEQEG